jgi:hypothetical protein
LGKLELISDCIRWGKGNFLYVIVYDDDDRMFYRNSAQWTSDKIIQDAMTDIGVTDFLEVKFYENRANGQSKGYCVLTVGSEGSLRAIHEKLPKKEIHGQVPVVTPPTKQALNQVRIIRYAGICSRSVLTVGGGDFDGDSKNR